MEKMNILLIMSDQHWADCMSLAGHPTVMTPNLDSIGGRGVRFTRDYSFYRRQEVDSRMQVPACTEINSSIC